MIVDSYKLKVPPPVYYISAFLIGLGLDWLWNVSVFGGLLWIVLGWSLVAVSIPIMPPVILRFKKFNTTFDVRKTPTALITDGFYRFSRNPSYVSLTMLYFGLSLLFDSAWSLVLLIPVLYVMNEIVIPNEEKTLSGLFGESYKSYSAKVRRWL